MNGKEKVLITGGLGNLGSWLTTFFANKYDIYVLSKNVKITLPCNYTVIQADIVDIEDLRLKLKYEFKYCIHTASYNEFFNDNYAKSALEINALGTRNLIEVLKRTKIKNFIYLSTFHVYGVHSGHVTEKTNLSPSNDYASTHLFAEYYLKQFYKTDQFPSVIFRLTNSYGAPRYRESTKWYLVLNDLVKSAYVGNKIVLKGNGKAVRDFIWMQDVCTIIDKSLNLNPSEENIFNLSSSETYSMLELAQKVKQVYMKKYSKSIEIIINENDDTKSENLTVDNTKLLKTFDNIKFQDKFCEEIDSIFNLLERY